MTLRAEGRKFASAIVIEPVGRSGFYPPRLVISLITLCSVMLFTRGATVTNAGSPAMLIADRFYLQAAPMGRTSTLLKKTDGRYAGKHHLAKSIIHGAASR